MATAIAQPVQWQDLLTGEWPPIEGTSLAALRRQGEAVATRLLPTARDEGWRFTGIAPLLASRYAADAPSNRVLAADIARHFLPEAEGLRLTFVDGVFAPELSARDALPSGLTAGPFAEVPVEWLDAHLGSVVAADQDAFTACAARLCRDGAWIHVAEGRCLTAPIQLLFVSSGSGPARLSTPRVRVTLERGAQATLVQTYVAVAEEATSLSNAVTEVSIGDGARLTHLRVQSESRQALHIETLGARLGRDAAYALSTIALGARLSRLDARITGTGTGMDASLDGMALLAGEQVADTHSALVHQQPHGKSRQAQRMILDGSSHAVFSGLIRVSPGAVGTDSAQSSRGLLLSPQARLDTKPELAIEADDVKCAHGAAVGQLDPEQLFYLRARGLDVATSEALLTYAFAAEALAAVSVPSLRRQLQAVLLNRTAGPSRQ